MAESFARRMMAQRLMTDARATPFSDSAGFGGRSTPDSLIRAIPDPVDASLANEAADLGRVAYGGAAMGSLFLPGAGVTDVFGYAPDPFNQGEFLPSFGENIAQGNYLDAGLQTLGVAGDVLQAGGTIIPPLAAVGTALKAPRAAKVAGQAADVVKIEDALRQKYPDVDLDVSETSQKLTLSKIVVPEAQRSSGVGTAVMSDLIAYADQRGLPVGLTPSTAFGGSKGRLQDFYKRFGFVPNKGRNKDFTFKETFVRQPVASRIKVTKTADVSDTFGEGAKSVTYTDPDSGGFIEVVQRKDGPTSVLALEVPEQFRGSGIGQELQAAAMADNPMLQGQVSSKAAAVGAYRLGRRPVGKPNATLEEVFSIIDDQSSVLMKRPDPNQAAGAAMDAAQARYFETGQFEPPTAENPVSVVLPTETEPGIIAFHGSGADFDEFRLEMIGTGEGAQAYGYGLYFTDSEDIAKFYRNAMVDRDRGLGNVRIKYKGESFAEFEDSAAAEADPIKYRMLAALGRQIERPVTMRPMDDPKKVAQVAKDELLQSIDRNIEMQRKAFANESASVQATMEDALLQDIIAERDALARIDPADIEVDAPTGKIYKVALSPKPDELLDYDKSLRQQPKFADTLKPLYEEYGVAETADIGTLFESIRNQRGISAQSLSERLSAAGIPGIKYRAAGSRGAATADEAAERNYVIFDDRAVKILEKYGIAGPVLVTGAVVGASKAGNDNEDGGSILPDAGVL